MLTHFQEVLDDLMVRVDTEVVTLIIGYVRTTHNAFLLHISQRKRIGRSSRSTGDAQCIALSFGVILEHGVNPIGIIDIAIGVINRFKAAPIINTVATIQRLLIHNGHILPCIQHISFTGYILDAVVSVQRNHRLAFLTRFGSNQHHTISSLRAIDGSRSSVFQDIYTFNVSRVQSRNITAYTINQIQGSGITDSTQTTDSHFHVSSRLTGSRSDVHTRCLPLHSL